MITNLNAISFAAALCLMWVGSSASRAEETPDNSGTAERQAILKEMRAAVAEIKVTEKAGDQIRSAKLIGEPIFRYSDEQRQIRDATMWVWTERGRPVSLLKLERYGLPDAQRQWLFNICSTSSDTLAVKWPFDHEFTSKKPGMTFQRVADGPDAAETKTARLIQLKQISRRFALTMLGAAAADDRSEMRLLPKPLFQYSSAPAEILDGALLGFSATGTNPDAVLAIQLRGADVKSAKWEFALTGMTTAGLEARLDDKPVWSQPLLVGRGQVFETWTWFFSERVK